MEDAAKAPSIRAGDDLEITVYEGSGTRVISSKTNPALAKLAQELGAYLDEHADED